MTTLRSALYEGEVVHHRHAPKSHRLRYRVFSMLFDLDELRHLDTRSWLFGYNRWAPFAFLDRDHGAHDGKPLRPWVESQLAQAGIQTDGGPVRLLCYPRVLGYVFNPLSVYFCYREDESLAAIIYEVRNTYHEQHTYILPVTSSAPVIKQSAEKAFYVSPFIGPQATYHFRVVPPCETVNVVIRQEQNNALLMAASFQGKRSAFTTGTLLRALFIFPLMTMKIMGAIHWEALKLWLKGFQVFPHVDGGHPKRP